VAFLETCLHKRCAYSRILLLFMNVRGGGHAQCAQSNQFFLVFFPFGTTLFILSFALEVK